MSEFVDFLITSPERFAALHRVFTELKHDKDAGDWRSSEDMLKLFDAESLNHFYWPPDDVRRQRREDLRTRPIILTPTEQATGLTWDFDSLMDAFINGEYNLLSCEMAGPGKARMSFYALAYPYGGVGCIVALIEAFGGVVTGIEDGTGFISFASPQT